MRHDLVHRGSKTSDYGRLNGKLKVLFFSSTAPPDRRPSEEVYLLRRSARIGLLAARANTFPGLVLNAIALLIVGTYYVSEEASAFWGWTLEVRETVGLPFAVASAAFFGGVIPFVVRNARARPEDRETLGTFWFWLWRWGLVGIELDLFYSLQAYVFGDSAEPSVVITKTAVDMFIFLPFWGHPFFVFVVEWRECRYRLRDALAKVNWGWYRDKVVPLLISGWFVWMPAMALVYMLPLALQLPVENVILCFWSLLIVFMVSEETVLAAANSENEAQAPGALSESPPARTA